MSLLWRRWPGAGVAWRAASEFPSRRCKYHEKESVKRSRLFYQSRKRGTLENGILLSSFTAKYLKGMSEEQLVQLDHLLNEPESDWQLYYWITGREEAPPEFDCEVLKLLQKHCQKQIHSQNQLPCITSSTIYH